MEPQNLLAKRARHWPGPSFDDSTHSLENTRETCVCVIVCVCMCDHVCVCVIFGRIGLCGTVLLRHDVEVRDRQSLFPFSLSFFSLSLRTLAESTLNFGFA